MYTRLLASALIWLCGPCLRAELPPIKPEVWEVKEADTRGCGAIILERFIKFHARTVEHFYLIRVLNEQGRNAIEFPKFLPSSVIEGRTVARDGTETLFKAAADFQTKALVETGKGSLNLISLIPPGLSSNCVVQVHWTDSGLTGLNSAGWKFQGQEWIVSLGSRLPIKAMEVEIHEDFPWMHDLLPGNAGSYYFRGKGFIKYMISRVPSYERLPYSEESAQEAPQLVFFKQPVKVVSSPAEMKVRMNFWTWMANEVYRPFFLRRFQYGSVWGTFVDEMCGGLPVPPQAAALELHRRLVHRLVDLDAMLPEEEGVGPGKRKPAKIDPFDFGEALKIRATNEVGLRLIYWTLLNSAGIPVKPVLMVDRSQRKMLLRQNNPEQFATWCLMVEEEGKSPIFIDPPRRFAPPDLILPRYQGTDAMALVPSNSDWSYKIVQIPIQDGSRNVQVVKVDISVGENKDKIHMESSSTGIQDWEERAKWWTMLPAERNKNLKERLEKMDSTVQIEKAAVGAYKVGPFGWSCDATRERDVSRHFEVNPFSLLDPPLYLPADLPVRRTERIVLPQIGLQEYRATIMCPAGFTWSVAAPFQQSNAFGEVSWTADPGASSSEVQVIFKVRTTALLSESSAYPEFKTFLAWVRVAFSRSITLNRSTS